MGGRLDRRSDAIDPRRGYNTKVSFAYARSEQNVSANPLRAEIVREPVETTRCRTL